MSGACLHQNVHLYKKSGEGSTKEHYNNNFKKHSNFVQFGFNLPFPFIFLADQSCKMPSGRVGRKQKLRHPLPPPSHPPPNPLHTPVLLY